MGKKKTAKGKKPTANETANKSTKPTAKGTKAPGKVKLKEKKKREPVEAARSPIPCAGGKPNPILVNGRNKRALCIAFAHELGGSTGTPEEDAMLIQCVRESGILWKSGMTLDSFLNGEGNEHLTPAEQSGRGYAMRCGRGRHDEYMAQYPEKVEACIPFAKAFIKMTKLKGEEFETARNKAMENVGDIKAAIEKAQAEAKANSKSKSSKPAKGKVTKKPAKKVLKTAAKGEPKKSA